MFDLIGGECGSMPSLSAYILLNPQKYYGNHAKTLELGCGIGLPSLLLAEIRRQQLASSPESSHIVLTDYESLLLENLEECILSQFEEEIATNSGDDSSVISLHHLDWLDQSGRGALPYEGNIDVVIGSALVYCPVMPIAN